MNWGKDLVEMWFKKAMTRFCCGFMNSDGSSQEKTSVGCHHGPAQMGADATSPRHFKLICPQRHARFRASTSSCQSERRGRASPPPTCIKRIDDQPFDLAGWQIAKNSYALLFATVDASADRLNAMAKVVQDFRGKGSLTYQCGRQQAGSGEIHRSTFGLTSVALDPQGNSTDDF